MDARKESSWNTTLLGAVAWIGRSCAYAGIVFALVYVGMTVQNVASQREQLRAHEQNQKTDMERIDAKNAAQNEKNAVQDERIAAQDARIAVQDAKNAAQDERLAELKETQVKILAVLEQQGRTLARLEERNEKALARLENKFDTLTNRVDKLANRVDRLANKVGRMDDFLRGGENSASLDKEGSAKNISASLRI